MTSKMLFLVIFVATALSSLPSLAEISIIESPVLKQPAPVTTVAAENSIKFEGVSESKVPGVICPLIDGVTNEDLLIAAENLAKKMERVKKCDGKSQSGAAAAGPALSDLVASAKKLATFPKDPEELVKSSEALKNYEAEVAQAIGLVDSISKNISTSLSDECGASAFRNDTDTLLTVTKIIQALSPYALTAVQANPAFAIGAKFIIGINGGASFISTLKKMHDAKTLDMTSEANQKAVLQNICEFGRINARINTFIMAKEKSLADATREMNNRFHSYRLFLTKQYFPMDDRFNSMSSPDFSSLDNIKSNLKSYLQDVKKNNEDLILVANQINNDKNLSLACQTTTEMAHRATANKQLPYRIINTLEKVTQNQVDITVNQAALIKNELKLRELILKQNCESKEAAKHVVESGKEYLDTLSKISELTATTIKQLRTQTDDAAADILTSAEATSTETSKNAGKTVAANDKTKYKFAVKAVQQEMDRLIAIIDSSQQPNVLKSLGADNSAVSMSSISQFVDESKLALFNNHNKGASCQTAEWVGDFFNYKTNLCPESPTLAYLNEVQKQMSIKATQFKNSMNTLKQEVLNKMTISGQQGGLYARDKNGKLYQVSIEQNAQDGRAAATLSPLNTKNFPEGTALRNNICIRLVNLYTQWYFVTNFFAQQQQVCAYIHNLQDDSFEKRLKEYCYRQDLPSPQNGHEPVINRNYKTLWSYAGADAQLVESKMKELDCKNQYNKIYSSGHETIHQE